MTVGPAQRRWRRSVTKRLALAPPRAKGLSNVLLWPESRLLAGAALQDVAVVDLGLAEERVLRCVSGSDLLSGRTHTGSENDRRKW